MLKRHFIGAVLPSMLAFAFSVYTIVDGFFIGRNIGDVNISRYCLSAGCLSRLAVGMEAFV